MSLHRSVDVKCDGCGHYREEPFWFGERARASARADGWRTNLPGGQDLCPQCRPHNKQDPVYDYPDEQMSVSPTTTSHNPGCMSP